MTLSKNFFLFVVAFFAMCTCAGGVVVALSGDGPARASIVVAAVAGAIAVAILWQQTQRDLDAVLTLAGGFSLGTALCVGIYLANAFAPGIVPKIVVPVAAIALAAVGHLSWGGGVRFTVGPLPDDLWAEPLGPPVQETLWQPRLGTVPRVVPNV